MKLTMPSLRPRRRNRLDVISAKLDGVGAQLSVLCKLYAGEPEAEDEPTPEPAKDATVLYLITGSS
jgi:hypothetical protein